MSDWSEWLGYTRQILLHGIGHVPAWIWFGLIGLYLFTRVGRAISREVAGLRESLESLEVQVGEAQEHLRQIARTLRVGPQYSRVSTED